jgi:hypothetical protein
MRSVGIAAAVISVGCALWIILWSSNLAVAYAGQIGSWCGTTGDAIYGVLTGGVPLALAAPYMGWWAAREAGAGVAVARCAALAAHAGWLTVLLIIQCAGR